jgi:ABC-type Co2+ transport system permease subunit
MLRLRRLGLRHLLLHHHVLLLLRLLVLQHLLLRHGVLLLLGNHVLLAGLHGHLVLSSVRRMLLAHRRHVRNPLLRHHLRRAHVGVRRGAGAHSR